MEKIPANIILPPRKLTRSELYVIPAKNSFVSKMRTLIPTNINEFTVTGTLKPGKNYRYPLLLQNKNL